MSIPQRPLGFSYKAMKALTKTAKFYAQPQHQWRMDNRLRFELTSNLLLMRELYSMANYDPYRVRGLLNDCEMYIRQATAILREPQQLQQLRNLPPNHPSIINNINHPLNPNNPNNLMLNPAMNLLFQKDEAIQASILEQEEEAIVENEQQSDLLASEILANEDLQLSVKEVLENNPELDPHKELGLSHNASSKQVEAACLSTLVENASEPGKKHSHEFSKAVAAAMLLDFGHKDHQHEDRHESMSAQNTAAPTAAG